MSRSIISSDGPSAIEKLHGETLQAWSASQIEPLEESERRRRVVETLSEICKAWIATTMITEFHLPPNEDVGGRIFATGSYRHNVHTSGSDIDLVLVAPERMTREHFFTTLVERLNERRDVKNLTFAADAIVPIISMVFDGIDIDLSFCTLQRHKVPDKLDMLDNAVLAGLDEVSVRSVNGVRVATLLIDLVPNTQVFRQALRFIKAWGKHRGVYSAKLGYPTGIGWAIMVAKACQCYPQQNGAGVVFAFFRFYKGWFKPDRINHPIFLTESLTPKNPVGNLKCWPKSRNDSNAVFPIITPAYPFANATYNVTATTLRTLCDEFQRSHEQIVSRTTATEVATSVEADDIWKTLLSPYRVFDESNYFLNVQFSCSLFSEYDKWVDYCEAKIRWLWTEGSQNRGAALECFPTIKIRVFTQRFEDPVQQEELQLLKNQEKDRQLSAMRTHLATISASPQASPQQSTQQLTPLRPSGGGAANTAASPQLTTIATVRDLFTCHFFFPFTLLEAPPRAPHQPSPPKPDIPRVIKAFQQIVMQDERAPRTAHTKPPVVKILKKADLPKWLGLEEEKSDVVSIAEETREQKPPDLVGPTTERSHQQTMQLSTLSGKQGPELITREEGSFVAGGTAEGSSREHAVCKRARENDDTDNKTSPERVATDVALHFEKAVATASAIENTAQRTVEANSAQANTRDAQTTEESDSDGTSEENVLMGLDF